MLMGISSKRKYSTSLNNFQDKKNNKLVPRGFSLGTLAFPLFKNQHSKFQFDQESYLQIFIYLCFIYSFIYFTYEYISLLAWSNQLIFTVIIDRKIPYHIM